MSDLGKAETQAFEQRKAVVEMTMSQVEMAGVSNRNVQVMVVLGMALIHR
jgi:hypothetical protein